jgi:hypothetical protein
MLLAPLFVIEVIVAVLRTGTVSTMKFPDAVVAAAVCLEAFVEDCCAGRALAKLNILNDRIRKGRSFIFRLRVFVWFFAICCPLRT